MKRVHDRTEEDEEESTLVAAFRRGLDGLRPLLETTSNRQYLRFCFDRVNRLFQSLGAGGSKLVLGFEDQLEGLGLALELNAASDRPPWAPIDAGLALALIVVLFDPQVRRAGLGRLLMNILTQSLTRNPDLPQMLFVDMVHFPMFYICDTFYGFVRLSLTDQGTPAGLIYPRHWPASNFVQRRENEEAIYAYTNLLWSTPVTIARARDAGGGGGGGPLSDRLNVLLGKITVASPHNVLDGVLAIAPLAAALGCPRREALAAAVSTHCKELGYSDPTGDVVMALVFSDTLLTSRSAKDARAVLAFCLDHCRVMYRPIVLSHGLVKQLVVEEDPSDLFAESDPWPRPHFERISETRWLWVPVKKPHSCTYDGKTYLPPPRCETPPLFVESLGAERPAKKQRTKLNCLHCAVNLQEEKRTGLAFCHTECSRMYYCS
jgi:GNAT superfamily N-acetyltransferase